MRVSQYVKVRGRKTVTFTEVLVGTTKNALVTAALEHAGENHHSIFNYEVRRPGVGWAIVTLYTD
jgi:hypothetical protein